MKDDCCYSYKKVMVIDDNEIDLYIAKRTIGNRHFSDDVMPYTSAVDALDYLKINQENTATLPEIIFVDIYMPEMSGFEFMDAYNDLSLTLKEHCSVYILSSTIDPNDIKRVANDTNVLNFHVKPIDNKFLLEICRKSP